MQSALDRDRNSLVLRLLAVGVLTAGASLSPRASGATEIFAGNYSFSDELGGFRLVAVSGTGTTSDPIVIVEEVPGTGPVTLVIRHHNLDAAELRPVQGRLTLIKQVINRSDRVWAGYDVELREIQEEPSSRRDGLSFNQGGAQPSDIASDTFTLNDRRFEPSDSISFQGGSVDPGETMRLRLTITDPTPTAEFYLVQDPSILSAKLQGTVRDLAARRD